MARIKPLEFERMKTRIAEIKPEHILQFPNPKTAHEFKQRLLNAGHYALMGSRNGEYFVDDYGLISRLKTKTRKLKKVL